MNNMPYFIPNYPNINSMQNDLINNLEKKIDNLYKELEYLKNKISKLEGKNTDYSYTYQPNGYNMM